MSRALLGVVVQARMLSTRLPGKVLADVAGKPMLVRVLERLRRMTTHARLVTATTIDPADDDVRSVASEYGLVFRGSAADVLDRYLQAAKVFSLDPIVRITADCPLIDPAIVDRLIALFGQERVDYASTSLRPTFPRGLDAEIFTLRALEAASHVATRQYEREHVTPYFYEHPDLFRLAALQDSRDYSDLRWTVDEAPDLEFVREVYRQLSEPFSYDDVLQLLKKHPELSRINAAVRQKPLHSDPATD